MLIRDYINLKNKEIKELQDKINKIKSNWIMEKEEEYNTKIKRLKTKLSTQYITFPGVTTLTEEAEKEKQHYEFLLKSLEAQQDMWHYNSIDDEDIFDEGDFC